MIMTFLFAFWQQSFESNACRPRAPRHLSQLLLERKRDIAICANKFDTVLM